MANVTRACSTRGSRRCPEAHAAALAAAPEAGRRGARRVGAALGVLLAIDPAEQRSTPLEIVRTVYREPTEILESAGVPPVVRDAFDERAWPEDRYDLAPRTLGDLGDPELAPLHLAWGMAKAMVLRARVTGRLANRADPEPNRRILLRVAVVPR